jgi:glycosyltransferase involved in cell wall biosynthesis
LNNFPRVSIITPSFNQSKYLEETIQSVLNQNYPNLEYIIIDGGSNDGSVEIIQKYANRLFYWVSEPDEGQSAAINKGLRHATGEIWAWMNSDDAFLPRAIITAVDWLDSHPDCGIVYGDCIWVDEEGNEINRQVSNPFDYVAYLSECNNFIPSSSTFIRREVTDAIGLLDESMDMVMDMDYWLRAGWLYPIEHLAVFLSVFRVYPEAKTWSSELSFKKSPEITRIYEKLFSNPGLPESVSKVKIKSLSNAYLTAAYYALKSRNSNAFWSYLWKSLSKGPKGWRRTHLRMILVGMVGHNFWKTRKAQTSSYISRHDLEEPIE